jgi:hypothetical protein
VRDPIERSSPSRLIAALSPRNERFAADASTTDLARSRSR